jgi:hypothetical protein
MSNWTSTATAIVTNSTTTAPPLTLTVQILDYVFMFISSVFYGSNYLPLKHYETGDGFFFQFMLCMGVWISGIPVYMYQGYPKFYAWPLFGGFLWSCGNLASVPVVKLLGIGLGSLFWNIVGLVVGWANARFGWFGVDKETPSNSSLNYLGVSFAVVSILVFVFVQAETQAVKGDTDDAEDEEVIINQSDEGEAITYRDDIDKAARPQTSRAKKTLGVLLSMFAGVMYGLSYTPILYVQDTYPNASQNQNDYAFSYNTGIFLGSLLIFIVYCIYKKNKPDIYPRCIFPAFVSGERFLFIFVNSIRIVRKTPN